MRPLFWARRGRRLGFATDPDVLLALRLASGEIDREMVAAYLTQSEGEDERTAFVGVARLAGGAWLEADLLGRLRLARWFHPEAVEQRPWTFDAAADALRATVVQAVADRARGRRPAVFLSGGRDSGSVAVAVYTAVEVDTFSGVLAEAPEVTVGASLTLVTVIATALVAFSEPSEAFTMMS